MSFHVYMLQCADGSIYTGHTDNLEARLAAHRLRVFSGYTASRLPVRLIFQEQFASREEAFAREQQIKGWTRRKKLALASGDWAAVQRFSTAHGEPVEPWAVRDVERGRTPSRTSCWRSGVTDRPQCDPRHLTGGVRGVSLVS